MDHGLTQMESDSEDGEEGEDELEMDAAGVGGSCYQIKILRAEGHRQIKSIQCTRLDSRKRVHCLHDDLPLALLHHFKTMGSINDTFELRTEAKIHGTHYRSHPNYRGEGPWYDYVNVDFQLTTLPNSEVFVNDKDTYPAKLVAFYRRLPETTFHVLAHCGDYQELSSDVYRRRSLLTRSWLYEVKAGNNPLPRYRTLGSVCNNTYVKGHIFAIEENPGFHERYPTEEARRFIVVSDMRKVWPRIFMKPSIT
jgi:hypothetical protein